jgi:hypothetical protein
MLLPSGVSIQPKVPKQLGKGSLLSKCNGGMASVYADISAIMSISKVFSFSTV